MIKTFRGKVLSGGEDTILLHTNDGSVGYKIHKLQILPSEWGAATQEVSVQVYTVSGETASNVIDFNNNRLLAVACQTYNLSANIAGDVPVVVFDNMIFNQDIFVVAFDADGNPVNYYIELEQVKLNLDESSVATLKNLKNLEPGG